MSRGNSRPTSTIIEGPIDFRRLSSGSREGKGGIFVMGFIQCNPPEEPLMFSDGFYLYTIHQKSHCLFLTVFICVLSTRGATGYSRWPLFVCYPPEEPLFILDWLYLCYPPEEPLFILGCLYLYAIHQRSHCVLLIAFICMLSTRGATIYF